MAQKQGAREIMLLQLLPMTILPMVLSPSYNDGGILLVGRDEQEGRMMLFAENGDNDHINHNIRNHILTLIGFILLSTLKSIIIGALVGKKCFRTRCCMSRHFLKAWCNSKYRSGSYKHCSWSRFRNKHDGFTSRGEDNDQGTGSNTRCGRSRSNLTLNQHDNNDQSKIILQEEERTTSLDDIHHHDSSLLNDDIHCHNRDSITHDRVCSDRTQTSSHAASTYSSSSSSLSFQETTTENQLPQETSIRIRMEEESTIKNKSPLSLEMQMISSMAHNSSLQTIISPTNITSPRKHSRTETSLLHLARLQDWDGMLMRLNTCKHPLKEARKRDGDGLLPLHWVCSSFSSEGEDHNNCKIILEVVLHLIKVYPQSVCELDMEGNIPLHYLLQQPLMQTNIVDNIVQALLEQDPSSIGYRNIHGHTPLWYACRNINHISSSVIQVLLQHTLPITNLIEVEGRRRSIITSDSSTTITPLSMAWKVALKDVRSIKRRIRMQQQQIQQTDPPPVTTHDSSQAWNNAVLLLRTVYYDNHADKSNSTNDEFPMILIATIQIKQTPLEVFDEVLSMYPHLVQTCDLQGNLPLMVALERFSTSTKDRSIHIVNKLLDDYPNGVKVPSSREGQLPMFVALRKGMTWNDGIERILHLYYDVLWMKDSATGLYPFMLAAAAFQEDGKSQGFFSRLWKSSNRRSSSTVSSSFVTEPINEQLLLMESAFDKAVEASSVSEDEDLSSEEQRKHLTFERKSSSSSTSTSTTDHQQSEVGDNVFLNASSKGNRSSHSSSSTCSSCSSNSRSQETKSRHKETQHQLNKLNTVYQLLLACPEAVQLK